MTYPEALEEIRRGNIVYRTAWRRDEPGMQDALCEVQLLFPNSSPGVLQIRTECSEWFFYRWAFEERHKDTTDWEIDSQPERENWLNYWRAITATMSEPETRK